MKLTYNWLKDFVEIKLTPAALAGKLTMAGLEVTSLEERGGDFVFEIEVTSNRPDWLSVVGIAREVAAITGKKLKPITSYQLPITIRAKERAQLIIEIEDKKDCPLYTAKIIRDVKVGPSPEWLKKRLGLIGCRSINNIVDIANYVLFTYGEPLHAFDLDKLVNPLKIIVRRAGSAEEIITIDGVKRTLVEDILVIASGISGPTSKPIAIAGIMGGEDTEVTQGTKNILLEAAIFNPVLVRRGRRKLGMQTDSSYRFERGIDCQTAQTASSAAVDLILTLAGGKLSLAKSSGSEQAKKKLINLDVARMNRVLGAAISAGATKKILSSLGFLVRQKGKNQFQVSVPALRQDVRLQEDLIEEAARIYGYEKMPPSLPAVKPRVTLNTTRDLISLIKSILTGLGLDEVITYSLLERSLLADFNFSLAEPVEIQNPLSKEQEVLRTTLMPSLLQCLSYNLNQKQTYLGIFEVAKAFSCQGNNNPKEEWVLGIAFSGEKEKLTVAGRQAEKVSLLDLKGVARELFFRLGIPGCAFSYEGPGLIAVKIAQEKVGILLEPQEAVLSRLEIKNQPVAAAEIYLEKVFPRINLKKKFIPLPLYPTISRDISLMLKDDVSLQDLSDVIKNKAGLLLAEIKVRDYYRGKQIPQGFKGLTISCIYRSAERTLTEEEVTPLHNAVTQALVEQFSAQIR